MKPGYLKDTEMTLKESKISGKKEGIQYERRVRHRREGRREAKEGVSIKGITLGVSKLDRSTDVSHSIRPNDVPRSLKDISDETLRKYKEKWES